MVGIEMSGKDMVDLNRFKLVMISAMYENGGNTLHRFLDGHPKLLTYPFESQLGTKITNDLISSFFPFKYRWPEFPLNGSPEDDFELFYDEELKTRVRSVKSSKFREYELDLNESERKEIFIEMIKEFGRTKKNIVFSFFLSTFRAWKNLKKSGSEEYFVGYSPIIGVDAEKMIKDIPDIKILHIVRNPFSAYAETKHRPFPLSLQDYTKTWVLVQYLSLYYNKKYPLNFRLIKFEDLIEDKTKAMHGISEWLEIGYHESMLRFTWNGMELKEVYPWGTIQSPSSEYNLNKIKELNNQEIKEILMLSKPMLDLLKYNLTDLRIKE
jgi:hypothetical protein